MDREKKPVSATAINDHLEVVFPNDLNSLGTLFGGRVLEICDRLAGIVAKRHSGRDCVTLGIDSVRFLAPARQGNVLIFKASLNRVWGSSMEIGLKVFAQEVGSLEINHILSAYFTFVAIGKDRKTCPCPEVYPETDEEVRRFHQAEERRKIRLRPS